MNLHTILGIVARDNRSGPCEDDEERTAPYLGICPEESNHEDGLPLDFGNTARPSASSYFAALERRWAREERNLERQRARQTVSEMTLR